MLSLRPSAFGQRAADVDEGALAAAKLVIFGEVHAAAPCIEMQCHTAEKMLADGGGVVHIVLEQCNFEQQGLLDAYADGQLTMAELVAAYKEGTEHWLKHGALEQLMDIMDGQAGERPKFIAGVFGSVWFDANLTGGIGEKKRTKLVRVTPMRNDKGGWNIMLDNTFDEEW